MAPDGFPRSRPAPFSCPAGVRRTVVGMSLTCSARGCQAPAGWALRWNNPKLHTPDRRKTWLACDEHRDSLGDFLRARGFLRDVEPAPVDEHEADPPD
jgi:hypothetical protein